MTIITRVDNPFLPAVPIPDVEEPTPPLPTVTLVPVTSKPVVPVKAQPVDSVKPKPPENEFPLSSMENISGSEIQVMFEFPTNNVQKSVYIHMSNIITVSHSVARTKIPVYLMGDTMVSGLALGTKMVAGSIVKLYTRNDALTLHIKQFVDDRFDKLQSEKVQDLGDVRSNISLKEVSDFMRDDLSPFNIHLITTSESDISKESKFGIDTIIGATLINTGNVFSIENLISEETISFLAKEVRYQTDISKAASSFYDHKNIPSGTSLLEGL